LADDIGISGVSGYGGQHKTPHIDALAKEGTRFEYCFAAPLCAPSRALLMTGRYPFRTGVLDNNSGGKMTPKSETIIARTLKDVGYITGFAGKWHQLGYMETVEEAKTWGFDEFLAWNGKKDGERYWAPHPNKNGKTLVGGDKDYGPDMLHLSPSISSHGTRTNRSSFTTRWYRSTLRFCARRTPPRAASTSSRTTSLTWTS
jgi:arylsulfatase A